MLDGATDHPKIQQYRGRQYSRQTGRPPPGAISPGFWLWEQNRDLVSRGKQWAAEKSQGAQVWHRSSHYGLWSGGVRHSLATDHGPGLHGQWRGPHGTYPGERG